MSSLIFGAFFGACTCLAFSRASDSNAIATADVVRSYTSPAAYETAVDRSQTSDAPGCYVKYTWAPSTSKELSVDMEVDHVWTSVPQGSNPNGNGVFVSSQYWYHDASGAQTAGGYMGSQVFKGSAGAPEHRVFIFSCWDVTGALGNATVGWTTPNCARFGGEGVGSHCILEYPIKEGTLYTFRVAMSGHNSSGAMWTGTVTDTTTQTATVVGTLFYPNVGKEIGFGKFGQYSNEFMEYFLGGDCDTDVHAATGTFGPFFQGRTVMPTMANPQYGTSPCTRTSVTGCVPGFDCGSPRVFVQGGEGVVRNNTDSTPLW
eukprot:m.12879 g.12879  ORF g.12879 m.12879 type:complete len:317 (-) comp9489_c0_seq1:474-1424(-)